MPDVVVTWTILPARVAMTALANVAVTPIVDGLRLSWDTPPANQGVTDIRERHRVTSGGTYGPQQSLGGIGTDIGGGRRAADIAGLTAGTNYTVELQPFREA